MARMAASMVGQGVEHSPGLGGLFRCQAVEDVRPLHDVLYGGRPQEGLLAVAVGIEVVVGEHLIDLRRHHHADHGPTLPNGHVMCSRGGPRRRPFPPPQSQVSHCRDGPTRSGRSQLTQCSPRPPSSSPARRTHLAYQTAAPGPPDLVFVGGSMATTLGWDDPVTAKGFRRLASFSRLVTYDQRGMGRSDRFDPSSAPTMDDLVEDLAAVVEAAGVKIPSSSAPQRRRGRRGVCHRAPGAAVGPVQYVGAPPRGRRLPDRRQRPCARRTSRSATGPNGARAGSTTSSPPPRRRAARSGRARLTSQNQLVAIFRLNRTYDIRHLLPTVDVPTLVIHLEDNANVPSAFTGRSSPTRFPGACLVLVPGSDHVFLRNYATPVIDEVEPFVTGRLTRVPDRMMTTMLFTDIVDSTPLAAALGDEAWSALIDEHNVRVRRHVVAQGGQALKSTGDGFLAALRRNTVGRPRAHWRRWRPGGPRPVAASRGARR